MRTLGLMWHRFQATSLVPIACFAYLFFSTWAAALPNYDNNGRDLAQLQESDVETLHSQEAEITNALIEAYSANVAGAAVAWDLKRNAIQRISNVRIPAASFSSFSQINTDNAHDAVRGFFQNNPGLRVPASELENSSIYSHQLDASPQVETIVHLNQTHQGIPVANAHVVAIFRDDKLISVVSSALSDFPEFPGPAISAERAITIARQVEVNRSYYRVPLYPEPENIPPEEPILTDSDLTTLSSRQVILGNENYITFSARPSWEVQLSDGIQILRYFIDAIHGDFLRRDVLTDSDSVYGKISGKSYSPNFSATPTSKEIPGITFLALDSQSNILSDVTDQNGDYNLGNLGASTYYSYYIEFDGDIYAQDYTYVSVDSYDYPLSTPPLYGVVKNQSFNFDIGSLNQPKHDQASNAIFRIDEARKFFNRPFHQKFNYPFPKFALFVDAPLDGCNAHFSPSSPINFAQSAQFGGFFIFVGLTTTANTNPPQTECPPSAYATDVVYHEFAHLIDYLSVGVDSYNFVNLDEGAAVREAIADYWAATMTNQSQIGEGHFIGTTVSGNVRQLSNNTSFSSFQTANATDPDFIEKKYENSLILSGALWHMRQFFINQYGQTDGVAKADELVIRAVKAGPHMSYMNVLDTILVANDTDNNFTNGTPDFERICNAFFSLHDIWSWYCQYPPDPNGTPTPTPTPSPIGAPKINIVHAPRGGTQIDNSFRNITGSSSAPEFLGYSLSIRPYGGKGPWSSSQFQLNDNGLVPVSNGVLGQITPIPLKEGCYYDVKLSTNSVPGPLPTANVVIKHTSKVHDEMPRMVCLSRTAHRGGENDACNAIAICSDPKDSYYNMTSTDWRRGRTPLISPRPSSQFNTYVGEHLRFGPALCDPDWHSDCLRDCWNITGEAGNRTGGNDGLDDIFCKAGAGCAPVSFSGCESTNSSCVSTSILALESVYYKCVYFHYAKGDYDINMHGESSWFRVFDDCDDDNDDQFYTMLGTNDDNVNATIVPVRSALVARDRQYSGIFGDIYDNFDQLYSLADGVPAIDPQRTAPRVGYRQNITPAPKCSQCGCPSTDPYCNTSGSCEQKCPNGTPFGQCYTASDQVLYCDSGTSVYGCNRSACAGSACGSGLKCETSTGRCVQCYNNADCNDNNSCTQDICASNGYCSHPLIPSDCSSQGVSRCGMSPSGCHQCTCTCDKTCQVSTGTCVRKPSCDSAKCKTCGSGTLSSWLSIW